MEGAFHTYASAPQLPKLKGLYIPLWFPPPCPLIGLFPRLDQPSPAQPFFLLTHSSSCCCPSRSGGTHGNFSPHWTLPPLLMPFRERNCVMALGSTRPPFKGMESFLLCWTDTGTPPSLPPPAMKGIPHHQRPKERPSLLYRLWRVVCFHSLIPQGSAPPPLPLQCLRLCSKGWIPQFSIM